MTPCAHKRTVLPQNAPSWILPVKNVARAAPPPSLAPKLALIGTPDSAESGVSLNGAVVCVWGGGGGSEMAKWGVGMIPNRTDHERIAKIHERIERCLADTYRMKTDTLTYHLDRSKHVLMRLHSPREHQGRNVERGGGSEEE